MFTHITIRKNQYYDSVFLMGVNNRLSSVEGVLQSAVFMGSDANKEVLTGLGFNKIELQDATENDLIVGVISETQSAIDEITKHLERVG
jgi:FdrA protein